MPSKFYIRALWICTLLIVLLAALQGLSGHWVAFFFLWPSGSQFSSAFLQAMMKLGSYHRVAGFIVGGLSLVVLPLAFLSKSNGYVKSFAVVGLVMTALAAFGGLLYVNSGYADRWSLGQMADAFVGVFGAYFIQLFFMNHTPKFPWSKA